MDTSSKAYKLLSLIAISGECSKDVYPFLYLTDSYNEKLMIPMGSSAIYTVTFTAELYKGGVLLGTYNHTVEIKNVEFKLGYCYNFKASLTHKNITGPDELNPIKFNVTSVENWNQTESNKDLNVPTTHSGI